MPTPTPRSRVVLYVLMLSGVTLTMSAATHKATAEVRFGKNVRIGGHDVSNQTFTKKRRGLYIIHDKKPPRPGCVWRRNGDGSKTKVCHFMRKRR